MQLVRDGGDTLYQQIADRLRYEIVTGRRATGERLPSLRAAADQWGVNLHTVRKAYQELARAGLVRIGSRGAHVVPLGPGASRDRDDAETIVREFADRVGSRFGMDAADIARMLQGIARQHTRASHTCSFIECSRSLSQALAAEIAGQFDVDVVPIDIHDDFALSEGPIIATYFHAADVTARVADRHDELHLVRIRPRIDLVTNTLPRARPDLMRGVIVVDRLPGSAHDLATDFRSALGEAVSIEIRILSDPLLAFPSAMNGTIVVASPQTWDRLTPELRARPDVVQLRYTIERADLKKLSRTLGWRARE